MTRVLAPVDELEQLRARSVAMFVRVLNRITAAQLNGNTEEAVAAEGALADVIASASGTADMLGRRRLLLEVDARGSRKVQRFAAVPMNFDEPGGRAGAGGQALIPKVPFKEAIADMAKRDPRLASGYKAVQELYSKDWAFALAKSSSQQLTERIQKLLANAFQKGTPAYTSQKTISELGDWTRAYAETVYRTNLTTAYTAGRFKQANEPEVRDAVRAFRYTTAGDIDVRGNHAAGEGFIAGVNSAIWHSHAPPNGYQ